MVVMVVVMVVVTVMMLVYGKSNCNERELGTMRE